MLTLPCASGGSGWGSWVGRWRGTSSMPVTTCGSTPGRAPPRRRSRTGARSGATRRRRPPPARRGRDHGRLPLPTFVRSCSARRARSARWPATRCSSTSPPPSHRSRSRSRQRPPTRPASTPSTRPSRAATSAPATRRSRSWSAAQSTPFDRGRPILELLGPTIVHQGAAGAGQHTKMVNQILIAGTMMGLCEALLYARATGLDPATVLESVGGGAAASWSLANLAPRILGDDLDSGLLRRALRQGPRHRDRRGDAPGLDLPSLDLARRLYASLADHDGARRATQALIVELADRSQVGWP